MRRLTPINRSVPLLGLVCIVAATAPLPSLAIEPTAYERAALTERRSIVQLHLEMDTELMEGNGVRLTRSKRTMWQDGEKRRCDEIREYLYREETEVPPHRLVSIETPEYFVHWDGRPQPPPTKRCAYFGSTLERNYKGYRSALPFDARLLGLTFSFILQNRDLGWDFLIGSPERAAPAVVEISGDQVKVSFTVVGKGGSATQEQMYEKRGERHLLRSVTVTESGTTQRSSMECTYHETLISGFAFPDSVECKMVRADNHVVFHDKTKIRLKSVNEAIPRSRFSIVTAELPPGTVVLGDAIPRELMKPFHHIQWNGEALVPVSNAEITLPQENDQQGRS